MHTFRHCLAACLATLALTSHAAPSNPLLPPAAPTQSEYTPTHLLRAEQLIDAIGLTKLIESGFQHAFTVKFNGDPAKVQALMHLVKPYISRRKVVENMNSMVASYVDEPSSAELVDFLNSDAGKTLVDKVLYIPADPAEKVAMSQEDYDAVVAITKTQAWFDLAELLATLTGKVIPNIVERTVPQMMALYECECNAKQ